MALRKTYTPEFEALWSAYPKFPKGRSKKHESFRKFATVVREDRLTQDDIAEIIEIVERMKVNRPSWQPESSFGPQGLQVFIHQRGWNDEYETVEERQDREPRRSNPWDEELRQKNDRAIQEFLNGA